MGKLRTHGVADWDPSGHPTRWTRRWGANKLQRTASPEAHCFPWLKCRPQRRLAAILAADVVRYSRLMEVDEAGTLAALKARRKEVLGRWLPSIKVESSRSPVTACWWNSPVPSTQATR
jgi:class 3 adenylate cyclase